MRLGWCSKRNDILLIVCGFSASYILDKVIHNKGGLYNRLSAESNLQAFSLSEVEEYLISNHIHLDHKSIEIVCLEHVDQIKMKLGISGVYTDTYAFQCQPDQENGIHGSQIDLLLDRADNIIDLCEIKYAKSNPPDFGHHIRFKQKYTFK